MHGRRNVEVVGESRPVSLLCVGRHASRLAALVSSRSEGISCRLAEDVRGALSLLAQHDVHAVVCELDGHDGRRLFQIMRARHARVWRVLVAAPGRGLTLDRAAAAALAHALVSEEGTAGIPALVELALTQL